MEGGFSDSEKLAYLFEFAESIKDSFNFISQAPDTSERVKSFAKGRAERIERFLKTVGPVKEVERVPSKFLLCVNPRNCVNPRCMCPGLDYTLNLKKE